MTRSRLTGLVLVLLAASLLVPANAAFLNSNLGTTDTLVSFNQFDQGFVLLDANPLGVYDAGNGFTIQANTPDFDSSTSPTLFGVFTIIGSNAPTSPYILNQSDVPPQTLRFALAGGSVSSIGIRISAVQGMNQSPLSIAIYDLSNVLIESHNFPASSTSFTSFGSDPDQAGFFGFEIGTATIARFEIRGGLVALDDLRFGGLNLASTGGGSEDPEPDPDPAAVPEASTFLLCAAALCGLYFAKPRGNHREARA